MSKKSNESKVREFQDMDWRSWGGCTSWPVKETGHHDSPLIVEIPDKGGNSDWDWVVIADSEGVAAYWEEKDGMAWQANLKVTFPTQAMARIFLEGLEGGMIDKAGLEILGAELDRM